MRLDAVEIKTSFVGGIGRALEALGLTEPGERRAIYFLEDTTPGSRLPLFHQAVVLRVRQGKDDDSTVKLRPCRRSQLTNAWLDDDDDDRGHSLKIEEDWAGDRKVLAASCSSTLPTDRIASAARNEHGSRRLFNERQERFLAECVGIPINLDALALLGPIQARRWDGFHIRGVDEPVAERWTVDQDLDFLEVSIRVEPTEAARAQRALDASVRTLGLKPDNGVTKTERVLLRLAGLE